MLIVVSTPNRYIEMSKRMMKVDQRDYTEFWKLQTTSTLLV